MRYLPKLQQLKVFQQVIRSGSIRGAGVESVPTGGQQNIA
jgi:hypothetical protein